MADPTPGSFTAGESTVQYAVSDGNFTPALVLGLDNATPPVLSLFIYVAGVPGFQKDLVTYDATGVAGTYKYDVATSVMDLDVGGDLTVAGDSALTGTLDVTGATTLGVTGTGALTAASATVTGVLTLTAGTATSSVANSGSNTAYVLDTAVAMAGSTNLLEISNHGTPKMTLTNAGQVTFGSYGTFGNDVDTAGNMQASTYQAHNSSQDVQLVGRVANGASAVAVTINNSQALSTSGAKLLSINNNSVEKAYVDKDGAVVASYYGFAAGAAMSVSTSGSDLVATAPTGGSIFIHDGQSGAHWARVNASGVEVDVVGQSFILKSPDGTRWKLAVADTTGALTAVLA